MKVRSWLRTTAPAAALWIRIAAAIVFGRLEVLGEARGRATGSDELDHPAPEFRRVRRWWWGLLRHRTPQSSGVHGSGAASLARKHGGRIWIEDGSPGAVFCVKLR